MQWIDVSMPMRPEMTTWPGDPAFVLTPEMRIAAGDTCNTSALALGTHTGTHCDVPWHFLEDGKRLEEMDTSLFFGSAEIRHFPGLSTLHAVDLGEGPLPRRLLLKTRNSERTSDLPFSMDITGLEPDAAERLVEEGVRLVGIDCLSVAPFSRSGPTHRILLEREVLLIEGLVLGRVPAGRCEFVVLPLPLCGVDGAPCRAFVGLRTERE